MGRVRPRPRRRPTAGDRGGRRHGRGLCPARGAGRAPRSRDGPVGRCERGRGRHRAVHRADAPHRRDRRRRAARGRAAGRGQRRAARRGRRARPLVPARPRERPLVDDRRERRHQRRRPVLRQVRRHARLCARPRGRHGVRRGRATGPAHRQGRGGLRPGRADGRLGGHARRGHRGHGPPAPRPVGGVADGRRVLRHPRRVRRRGRRRHGPGPAARGVRARRPPLPAGGERVEAHGLPRRRGGAAPGPHGSARAGRRPGGGGDPRRVRGGRCA